MYLHFSSACVLFVCPLQLCDVERAELYLSVLKEVVLMYSVLEWNHSKVQEAYFPRLLRYVLRILEADQVQYYRIYLLSLRLLSFTSHFIHHWIHVSV